MMGNLVNKKSPQDVRWACTQAMASRPFGTSRSNLLANVQDWLKNTWGKSPNPKWHMCLLDRIGYKVLQEKIASQNFADLNVNRSVNFCLH